MDDGLADKLSGLTAQAQAQAQAKEAQRAAAQRQLRERIPDHMALIDAVTAAFGEPEAVRIEYAGRTYRRGEFSRSGEAAGKGGARMARKGASKAQGSTQRRK